MNINLKNITFVLMIMLISFNTIAQKLDRTKAPQPGPAPKINIGEYKTFTLDNGLKVFVVENHKIPLVTFNLTLDIKPVLEGNAAGVYDITGSMLRTGTVNRSKEQIDEQIDFIGGNLNVGATFVSASSLKKHTNALLDIMSDVLLNPTFPQQELDKFKKQMISGLAAAKEQPNTIAENVAQVIRYGKNHPYGQITTEETVKNITVEKCKNYYNTYFKPNVAYLVVVGDITETEARQYAEKFFGKWQKAEVPVQQYSKPSLPNGNQVVFVDKAGAVQSVIKVTYALDLTPGHPDEIAADVMNSILGGGVFSGRLMMNLRENKGYTYGARSRLISDPLIGYFEAGAQVRGNVTDSAVMQFLYEIKRMTTEMVDEASFNLTKSVLAGDFARAMENPSTIARFALNIARYNLPKDYYQNYLLNLSKITLADVQAMAKKYLKPENCYIVVVGNKEKESAKLKRYSAKNAVDFFDIYGNPFTEVVLKPIPQGVTAQTVIANYTKAIGGTENISKIQNLTMQMEFSMQGMTININIFNQAPNKSAQVVNTPFGSEKQVFDGQKGIKVSQGQTKEVTGNELIDMKESSVLFADTKLFELGYNVTLLGIESINGKDAYKMDVVSPAGKKSVAYFDVETSLKIRVVTTQEARGNQMQVIKDMTDYKDVDGVKFPFSIVQSFGGREMKLEVKKVDIKTKIADETFSTK